MEVTKRNGTTEPVMFDKITARLRQLCDGLDTAHVDPVKISQKCVNAIYDGISTYKLDILASEIAFSMYTEHPDYGKLAARVVISDYHKRTCADFYDVMKMLHENEDSTGNASPLVTTKLLELAIQYRENINSVLCHKADFNIGYMGFKNLERSYLMRINDVPIERPQHMFMRVAIQIHLEDCQSTLGWNWEDVAETYRLMMKGLYIHATPTLFNSGTPHPQLSSCFLHGIHDDSIEGIYHTNFDCAITSKWAGGVGCHIHSIRGEGSLIRGTNGLSTGIVPMLQVLNSTFRYVNQGGRRNGSCAIYIEPWHSDIEAFLDLRKTHGDQSRRCLDLFTALWIPDLFMRRVEENADWSLFCPDTVRGLSLCYGEEFEEKYTTAEEEGLARKVIPAQELFMKIMTSQWETGTPYMLYKDAINRKSNQKNLGTIQCSNLCTEIVEYTSDEEMAVCNLASIVLPKFVKDGKFDFDLLFTVTKRAAVNLDKIIDVNFYALEKARRSNERHRPIGLGVQGLADCFILLRLPFCSAEAKQLNKDIFETIYYAALTASNEVAGKRGVYSSFHGSPASQGILQYDMWDVTPSDRWDWDKLKDNIRACGLRNSLLVAPMPTASTASILGNNECFEPYTSNLYVRRVLSGEFVIMNEHLVRDLINLGLWNEEMKNTLIKNHGSIQHIDGMPEHIKDLYKTVWEMKMRDIIDMAADRGAFVDQSQSLNLFVETPTFKKLYSMHMHSWKKGLKTGMYYLRTRAAADPIQFTVRKKYRDCDAEEGCLLCSA